MHRACLLAGLVAGAAAACGPSVDDTDGGATSSTAASTSTSTSTSTATEDASTGTPTTGETSGSTGVTGDASATSESSAATTADTTGPVDPAVCAGAAAIELKDATATPEMGPGWEPGESVMIGVTLHNAGAADFLSYPGIRVVADHPGVTAAMPENWLFALLLGQDNQLSVSFTAAADVPAPSVVTFTIEVVVLNQSCPGLMRVDLPVDLQ